MSPAPPQKVGPYEILAPLGSGGMGQVFRARDPRLNREVALKLLPPEYSADPVRKQRFEQEARAIAALNHPGIVSIYDVGEGWMVTVQSPDAKTNFRNLMGGALARWWTEESSSRLMKKLPGTMGALALAQDGGVAASDLTSGMSDEQVTEIAREFFLT